MSIIVKSCPQCGSSNEVEDSVEKQVCFYCGTVFGERLKDIKLSTLDELEVAIESGEIKTREEEEIEKVSVTAKIVGGSIIGGLSLIVLILLLVLL